MPNRSPFHIHTSSQKKIPPALEHLQHKLTFINMLFVSIVLVVVLVTVYAINLGQWESDIYSALQHRIDETATPRWLSSEDSTLSLHSDDAVQPDGTADSAPNSPRENSLDQIVATSVIIVNEDGSVAQTLEDSLGLDEDTLRTAIQDVLEKADGTPTRGSNSTLNLYYQSKQVQSGTKIVFASSNYVDKNTTSLILTLLGAGCIALIGFYIASRFMARWAIKPVQHAWEQQQQFIGNASHELKTPLTVILANNAILQSQPTSTIESQQQWIESTEEEAHSMQELVNDMLFLAQSEGEMPSTAFQPINLTDIVERATLRFEAIAYEKGLHLDEKPIDKHVMISGDVQRIRRLVWALVDNACKYNCENGHVGISLTRTGNTCHLIVSNSGGLIDKEDLPHLFDRFYRGNHARTRDGGFGLGLSIAYSVVASHKGSIYATSTPEDGTIFTVTLPVIPDKEQREIEEK